MERTWSPGTSQLRATAELKSGPPSPRMKRQNASSNLSKTLNFGIEVRSISTRAVSGSGLNRIGKMVLSAHREGTSGGVLEADQGRLRLPLAYPVLTRTAVTTRIERYVIWAARDIGDTSFRTHG